MLTPANKLAASLKACYTLQAKGQIAIRSSDLTRTYRKRLCRNGFLQEITKCWQIPTRPDETAAQSTAWFSAFSQFCSAYLKQLKGDDWCLSPEQSLSLHAENWAVRRQLLVRAVKARNNVTVRLHGASLLDIRASLPDESDTVVKNSFRQFTLPAALIACNANTFRQNPTDMQAAMSMVRDASEVLQHLLAGGTILSLAD